MLLRLLVGVLAGPVWSASARGIGGCEVLDLTHALDRNNPYHPVFRPFDLQYKQRGPYKNLPYVEWNFYCTYEHLGTHIDAPLHFSKGGQSVDQIPLSNLIKEACVIDVRDKVRLTSSPSAVGTEFRMDAGVVGSGVRTDARGHRGLGVGEWRDGRGLHDAPSYRQIQGLEQHGRILRHQQCRQRRHFQAPW